MWYEWIFSGIGTTILTGIGGMIIGGISGYQIGIHSKGKQYQKAGAEAKQRQDLELQDECIDGKNKIRNFVKQTQKAGNEAEQIQVGSVKNGK